MFSKRNRLPKPDFALVFHKGNRIYDKYFTLIYRFYPPLYSPQIGIIIGAKVGIASIRNKTKRRLREIIREEIPKLKPSLQLIFQCRKEITLLDFINLQQQVKTKLKEAALYQ
jgi:ribonuclease P protein component